MHYYINLFITYLEKGGIVNSAIAVVCFVALYFGYSKITMLITYHRPKKVLADFLRSKQGNASISIKSKDWFLNYFITLYQKDPDKPQKYYYNCLREKMLEIIPQLDDGFDIMASWISVSPLLGLLGTVIGMVQTFTIITNFGIGNPNLLSEGISVALLTTQSGLIVAFPCMLLHNFLLLRKNTLIRNLITDGEKLLNWIETRKKPC